MPAGPSHAAIATEERAETEPTHLGGRISHAREAQGLSLAQAARRLGVKSTTLRSWETGESDPRANKLATLAGVLGVTPSWLLTGVGLGPTRVGAADEIDEIRAELLRLGDKMSGLLGRMKALAARLEDIELPAGGAS